MKNNTFWTILGIAFIGLILNMPKSFPVKFSLGNFTIDKTFYKPPFELNIAGNRFAPNTDFRYGLDLAGGAAVTFSIDTSNVDQADSASALESLKANIERRVNLFGISESTVQISSQDNNHRLIVELPGVTDVNQAIALVGKTAQLTFKGETPIAPEATATATWNDLFSADTGINGSHLVRSSVQINPNNSQPEVAIEFNPQGTKLFETATKEYLNKRIAIFLDDELITFPTVQSIIPDGRAVINGSFTTKAAKELSAQLNAGALPLPIEPIRQTSIGATLGADSVNKGLFAAVVGLSLVCLFMILNYGYLGFIACISLIIYTLITLSLYRLIPITLTFPGIVGFILSIGMAVDSNILIFERMREELRAGKPWTVAMELGFGKAWDSIKDANACTIITGLILFNPLNWNILNTSGMVRGFAITLLLGIAVGIFTGVVVTRNLIRVLAPGPKTKLVKK